jgi:hypothetical protein
LHINDLQYFPKINYLLTLVRACFIAFSGDAAYIKSSFMNKMELPGSNGIVKLSIPIKGGRSVKALFKDVEIDHKTAWQTNHLRTISSFYGNPPFYPFYENSIQELYGSDVTNLFQWNLRCFEFFVRNSKISNMIHYETVAKDNLSVTAADVDTHVDIDLFPAYHQVFDDRVGFVPNMSCLDLLMNVGPDTATYVNQCLNKLHSISIV